MMMSVCGFHDSSSSSSSSSSSLQQIYRAKHNYKFTEGKKQKTKLT
jgi:hypothetical protein